MKTHAATKVLLATLVIAISLIVPPFISAQQKPGKIKIGIYDSRAVIFAYSRSRMFRDYMKNFSLRSDSAEKANDTVKIRELSIHAMSFQHLLHQQIFCTGTVMAVVGKVADKLPGLAKKNGVLIIMSKFEIPYKDEEVELIDLTSQVVTLFNPMENIDKMLAEISKAEPVALDDLDIEEDMLNLYCKRFGQK